MDSREGRQEALQQKKAAEAKRHGEDCARLGTVSQHRLLVSVAKSGHKDHGVMGSSEDLAPNLARLETAIVAQRLLRQASFAAV